MGLAYELVINSSPCISYNMEENTTCLMILVLAHAAYGHNHFFKNNYLFKQFTHADHIIDYMQFAKNYISECEEKYGLEEVELTLDACHALMNYGVDKYKKPNKLSASEERERFKQKIEDDRILENVI
jgi:spore cortex formation protein SpoVR/YcgB (stage V sporulation)